MPTYRLIDEHGYLGLLTSHRKIDMIRKALSRINISVEQYYSYQPAGIGPLSRKKKDKNRDGNAN